MRLPLSFCIILCAPWLAVSAVAQQAFTESEAIARVSLESPRARAIRAHADLARADALAARRIANPSVTASREAVSGVAEHYLPFSQPSPVAGRRTLQRETIAQVRARRERGSVASSRAGARGFVWCPLLREPPASNSGAFDGAHL